MSAVEVMACGKPVLVSNFPGISEVVSDDELLFPVGDNSLMASKIIGMCQNADNNKALIDCLVRRSKLYDIRFMIRRYEDLYERLSR